MNTQTTNYKNTFIAAAEDCPVSKSEIPTVKRNKTLANIQYEMISRNPYKYTSDEVLLECFYQKNNTPEDEKEAVKEEFFSKSQPCLRSSALGKRYGFGFHFNEEEKVALYPMESKEYQDFAAEVTIEKLKAMRNKRG